MANNTSPLIYVIGNSHAHYFTQTAPGDQKCNGEDPLFRTFSIGPIIAYNFYEHHLKRVIYVLSTCNIDKSRDWVMFVVGEVDCRFHLPRRSLEKRIPINKLIRECVHRYFRAMNHLHQLGYRIICFGVHPSCYWEPPQKTPDMPIVGSPEYRNTITIMFNQQLAKCCGRIGVPFINIYNHLVDVNGKTNKDMYKDYCHLNEKSLPIAIDMIRQKLNIIDQ